MKVIDWIKQDFHLQEYLKPDEFFFEEFSLNNGVLHGEADKVRLQPGVYYSTLNGIVDRLLFHQVVIESVPEFTDIDKLRELSFWNCPQKIIDGIHCLAEQCPAVTEVDLSYTGISELPESIGNLESLHELDLSATQISRLPESIENLTSLTELDLSSTMIKEVPECIGNLRELTSLNLSGTEISELPESIENLTALTVKFV